MNAPPPYPRIPHLVPGRGTSDDHVLAPEEVAALLTRPLLVEEKLDGANVVVWIEDGRIECALRSGPGSQDRSRQLGPFRAWIAERADRLHELLRDHALYAEWLLVAHGVRYDALPAYCIGLDLWSPRSGFLAPEVSSELLTRACLAAPPLLHHGTLESVDRLEELIGRSHAGAEPMEGVIVRAVDGREPRIAKLLRVGFSPATDADWRRGRPRNLLRERAHSWH